MDTFARVKKVVETELRVPADKITMEARLKEDLKADSLDMLSLVNALEEEFKAELGSKEIDDRELKMTDSTTLGDVVQYLDKQIAA
jgi:acyl carrier protein